MFTQDTLAFLAENRMRNSREWFQENKSTYVRYVLEPLADMAMALSPTIHAIDEQIVTEPKVDRCISRIYRDTRFAKDKMLYREQMWLSMRRDKKACPNYPEFFFVISPDEFLYGCGFYAATPQTLQHLRSLVLQGHPLFLQAQSALDSQSAFVMEGDCYVRSKFPEASQAQRNWLDRKGISVVHRSKDFAALYGAGLPAHVAQEFAHVKAVYDFFLHAVRV